jgi:Phage integrase family
MRLRSVSSLPGPTPINARFISPNTEIDYESKLRSVRLFFGGTALSNIHWYNLRAYQEARVRGDEPFVRYRRPQDARSRTVNGVVYPPKGKSPCPALPQQVNQELRLVKKLKVLAGCWTAEDEAYFQNLQIQESDVERALDPSQQQLWLDACRSRPRWNLVLWWSIISFDLITSPGELRGLQLVNVNLAHQSVRIPWPCSKNRFRHRNIPIGNPETVWAFECVLERALEKGSREPQHYLFPFIVTRSRTSDPQRPMTSSGLKKLWQEVREATGLHWFRMEDTRHTGATRMAESGIPAPVIMARMGHSNIRMQQHYTHITEQAQKLWLRHAATYPPRIPPRSDYSGSSIYPVGNFSQKSY